MLYTNIIKNIEYKKEYAKKYNSKNKEIQYIREKEYKKRRRKIDPIYKLHDDLRSRISQSLKKYLNDKKESTLTYLGISISEFISYIENQFLPEMSWDNRGKIWELDHIIPISFFDLSIEENIYKCFHYSNHQPLFKTTEIAESFGYQEYIGNRNKYNKII